MSVPLLTLRHLRPSGVLRLSPDDVTRHVLGVGSTGSGKTTALVNPCLQQLIAWRADDPDRKIGLLILDGKCDETEAKVREYARQVGREGDMVVLSPQGLSHYDFFAGFGRLAQVDEYATRLQSGTREMGDHNAYWTETRAGLIQTALTLLVATDERVTFDSFVEFARAWWFSGDVTEVTRRIAFLARLLAEAQLPSLTRRRLELAIQENKNWQTMDGRTKELHRSTLGNCMRPLLSPSGSAYFSEGHGPQFHPQQALDGKILVVACNATAQPQLASFLFCVLKRDFFDAIESRTAVRSETGRLAGLVADEMHLVVTEDDVSRLSVCRSKGGFALCCTQSLAALDQVLGRRQRDAMLANFNTVFFFSSREDNTDEFALLSLGTTERRSSGESEGRITVKEREMSRRPVCPPGSLSRLAQHECYAKLANGVITTAPVRLEPSFINCEPSPVVEADDGLADAARRLREKDAHSKPPQPDKQDGVAQFLLHMHQRGYKLMLSPSVLAAAWQVCAPKAGRNQLLGVLRIEGLEGLPSCWLAGLVNLLRGRRELARMIRGLTIQAGVLWPELDLPCQWWGDGVTAVPELLNKVLYPSLWRPLKRQHLVRLHLERPDLSAELESLSEMPC